MAYVPPHLRNRQNATATPQSEAGPRSLESRLSDRQNRTTSPNLTYSLDDIADLLGCAKHDLSTLTVVNRSNSDPPDEVEQSRRSEDDVLRAIVLFSDQHPEWKSEHKILCKSNLHVLHKLTGSQNDQTDHSSTHSFTIDESSREYPIFQEFPFMKNKCDFAGWWRIQSITFLAAGSADLITLFEKKFSTQDKRGRSTFSSSRGKSKTRTEEAWRDSLNREWAVVTLAQNHARRDPPEPALRDLSNTRDELSKDSANSGIPSTTSET